MAMAGNGVACEMIDSFANPMKSGPAALTTVIIRGHAELGMGGGDL